MIGENPAEKTEASEAINQVKTEMGGQIEYERLRDTVGQILPRLAGNGPRAHHSIPYPLQTFSGHRRW